MLILKNKGLTNLILITKDLRQSILKIRGLALRRGREPNVSARRGAPRLFKKVEVDPENKGFINLDPENKGLTSIDLENKRLKRLKVAN